MTPQQASDLANQYLAMAQAIGDFRYKHWDDLSAEQHRRFARLHGSVVSYGEDMLTFSTDLVLDDAEKSLTMIRGIAGELKKSFETLQDIQKVIDICTSVVTLGASIVSRSPDAIEKALESLISRWKKL